MAMRTVKRSPKVTGKRGAAVLAVRANPINLLPRLRRVTGDPAHLRIRRKIDLKSTRRRTGRATKRGARVGISPRRTDIGRKAEGAVMTRREVDPKILGGRETGIEAKISMISIRGEVVTAAAAQDRKVSFLARSRVASFKPGT